ncbi:hypothetical protein CBR_g37416 [Chara braunii]|uniref:Uncharacterized protein n=1 Tax=Chara braunii TaxID=69332 RepID=A0A388LN28_CHABU|nr:hypothetical protein CBR_g37416 [Chara braunii]|eukprot:GBG83612.1 hypothetical protein CBR_g37416 [Chara braunii]
MDTICPYDDRPDGADGPNDDTVVLDFRTAFEGSLFEKWHVLPLQMACLDTSASVGDAVLLHDFVSEPGRIRLMRENIDAFANGFAKHCKTNQRLDYQVLSNLARKFAAEFLQIDCSDDPRDHNDCECGHIINGSAEDDGSSDGAENLHDLVLDDLISVDDLPAEGHLHVDVKKAFATSFLRYCFSVSSPQLKLCFSRWGKNVNGESDQILARRLFDYCEKECRDSLGKSCFHNMVLEEGSLGFLVDFDLAGSDGRTYPLRMLMLDGYWTSELSGVGSFAHVRERDTGVVIAKANGGNADDSTIIRVVAEELVQKRYKPHGNIPTLVMRWWGTLPIYFGNIDLFTDWDVTPKSRRMLTPEELESVRSLHEMSFNPGYLVYASQSEVERLIPVAASLTRLVFGTACPMFNSEMVFRATHRSSFNYKVIKYGLRLSTLGDVKRYRCHHFARLFKGSMWEQLPEELVQRIVGFLPPRHMCRPPASFPTIL